MSKAFTKEDDGATPPDDTPPALPPGPRHISAAGHARLVEERARLQAEPAGQGRRLRLLDLLLERLIIVPIPPARTDRVHFGAQVTVEDDAGERTTWRILGPDENEGISVDGPLARALLGRGPDDVVTVRLPRGAVRYTIVEIEYPGG